jgi:hypothetical protein
VVASHCLPLRVRRSSFEVVVCLVLCHHRGPVAPCFTPRDVLRLAEEERAIGTGSASTRRRSGDGVRRLPSPAGEPKGPAGCIRP